MNLVLVEIIKEFFPIPKGVFITDPDQKIKITELDGLPVFMKRRSLKHFIESRRENFKKFDESKQLELILDLANDITATLISCDMRVVNPKRMNSHIYLKKIDDLKTPRSVVLENFPEHYEIVSVHIMKEKDYEDYLKQK